MPALIAQVMPHAVAVALSPIPIAALILLLLSNNAKVNSILFLLGWMSALILNVLLFAVLADVLSQGNHQYSTRLAFIVHLVLGLALLFFAWKQWHNRLKPGEEPKTPQWMQTLETLSPWMAFVIAFSLVTINAKNTVIDITAGVIIGQATNTVTEMVTAVLIFAAIASLTIAVPVFAFLLLGKGLDNTLQKTKQWFIYNSPIILFVLFLILGINILSKAFW